MGTELQTLDIQTSKFHYPFQKLVYNVIIEDSRLIEIIF